MAQEGFLNAKCGNMCMMYVHAASLKWSEGACSGTVYSGDEKLTELMAKVAVVFNEFVRCEM